MASLSHQQIHDRLRAIPGWTLAGKTVQKKFTFKAFLPAVSFVNKLVEVAEKVGHHPDITINYNVVGISLSTHSQGGVTEKDLTLAGELDRAAATID